MGYLLGTLWSVVFGWLGLFLMQQRQKHAAYPSFTAKVEAIETIRGRNTAILRSDIEQIGTFHIAFQDLGDFSVGASVQCIWDGRSPSTAQQDLRENQKLGARVCFVFVGLMVLIMLLGSFL